MSAPQPRFVADAGDEQTRQELRRRVVRYYRENQFFYDRFWTDASTRSMNYGFWDADTCSLAQAFRNQNREIARSLRVRPADTVLEAGCGIGGATVWIARTVGSRGIGITLCRRQAERGAALSMARGVSDRAGFLVMDYTAMGFADESFTGVFASESVCYAWRKAEFLAEAHRVLRPGGRLVVVDGFRADRTLEGPERAALSRWCKGWAVPFLASVAEFEADLRATGFRDVAFTDHTEHILPSARRIWARGAAAYPLALAAHRLGAISDGQLGHVRSSLLQHSVWRDRIALHGLFSARK